MFYHIITNKILIIKTLNKTDDQILDIETHSYIENGMHGVGVDSCHVSLGDVLFASTFFAWLSWHLMLFLVEALRMLDR